MFHQLQPEVYIEKQMKNFLPSIFKQKSFSQKISEKYPSEQYRFLMETLEKENLTLDEMQHAFTEISAHHWFLNSQNSYNPLKLWLGKERSTDDFKWAIRQLSPYSFEGKSLVKTYLNRAGRRSKEEIKMVTPYYERDNNFIQFCKNWLAESDNISEDFLFLMNLSKSSQGTNFLQIAPTIRDLENGIRALGRYPYEAIMKWAQSEDRSFDEIMHIVQNKERYGLLEKYNSIPPTDNYLAFFKTIGSWLSRNDHNLSHLEEVVKYFSDENSGQLTNLMIDALKAEGIRSYSAYHVMSLNRGSYEKLMSVLNNIREKLPQDMRNISYRNLMLLLEQEHHLEWRRSSVMNKVDFEQGSISFAGLKDFLRIYRDGLVRRDDYGVDNSAATNWLRVNPSASKEQLFDIMSYFESSEDKLRVASRFFKNGVSREDLEDIIEKIDGEKNQNQARINWIECNLGQRHNLFSQFAKEGRFGDLNNVENIYSLYRQIIDQVWTGIDTPRMLNCADQIYGDNEASKVNFIARAINREEDICAKGSNNKACLRDFIARLRDDSLVIKCLDMVNNIAEASRNKDVKFSPLSVFQIAKNREVNGCEDVLGYSLDEVLKPEYKKRFAKVISEEATFGNLFFYFKFQGRSFEDFTDAINPEFLEKVRSEQIEKLQERFSSVSLVREFSPPPSPRNAGAEVLEQKKTEQEVFV
jgi:hypothetical protein